MAGYAFAGDDRTVVRVDVTVDGGGSWGQADLDAEPTRWTWRFWHARVELLPGRVEIMARAWDSTAAVQPEHPATVWNPKGYVNNSSHAVTVTATATAPHPGSRPR